jgi:methylated-DNA-[protein]-cysteine S-methyltransferase
MDSNNNSFNERCYEILKLVPEGKVTTYRDIAKALNTNAWRAVGSAMAKNKKLFVIPCHRVVRSNGTIGEYALGSDKKAELLIKEGVAVKNGKVKDLGKFIHRFSSWQIT